MLNREDRLFRRFRRRGDPDALAAVFDATAPDLLRLAHLLVGATAAEDLVQATFVDAIEHCERYDETRRVRPWLCGLLAMHARRLRRSRAAEAKALRASRRADQPSAPAADQAVVDGEVSAQLERAFDDLGEPYRSVARLHLREGLNAREIAERVGRPAGTVRTQIVRALERLRRGLPSLAPAAVAVSVQPGLAVLAGVRRQVLELAAGKEGSVLGTSAVAGTALVSAGVLVMKKIAWGVLVVILCASAWWWFDRGGDARPTADPVRPVATAELGEADPVEPRGDAVEPIAERQEVGREKPADGVQGAGRTLLVRNEAGEPVADRGVTLRIGDRLVARGRTGGSGRWEPDELPEAGVLRIAGWQVRVGELPEQEGVHVWTVAAGRTVRGRVLDVQDRPIAGADVRLEEVRGARRSRDFLDPVAVTGSAGTFDFEVTDGAQCVLSVRAPGHETVGSPMLDLPVDEIVLRMTRPGRRLQGRVLDPEGQPVPHARLTVFMLCNEERRIGDRGGRYFETVFDADPTGSFDVRWLPAGSGVVAHSDAPLRPHPGAPGPRWTGRADFDLRHEPGAVVVVRGAAVTGLQVLFLDAAGTPVEGAHVAARDAHGAALFAGAPLSLSERTDAVGRAAVEGLPATRIRVGAQLGGLTASQELDLVAGETRALTLRAEHQLESLVVQLVDPEGEPLAGWPWRVQAQLGTHLATRTTDADGIARLRGVAGRGPLTVKVLNQAGIVGSFEGLAPRAEPHRLEISTGVGAPGRIEGRLERPEGADESIGSLAGRLTFVLETGGAQMEARLRDGRFHVDRVPPGRYRCAFQSKLWWLEPTEVIVPAGEDVDVGVLRLQAAVRFRVSCAGLTPAEAAATRVLLGQPEKSVPMAGLAQQDADRPDAWNLAMGLPPARYRILLVAPGYVPAMRDVDAGGGVQLVEFRSLQRGIPVRLRITCPEQRGPFGMIAQGSVRVCDESGATVLHERIFGHFDDVPTRTVAQDFALAAGDYTLTVSESGVTAERSFTVPAGVAEHRVEIDIE